MNTLQRENVTWSIDYAKHALETLVTEEENLSMKRLRADCQLIMLLKDVVRVLPQKERHAIQECLSLHDRVWEVSHTPMSVSRASSKITDGSFSTLQAE